MILNDKQFYFKNNLYTKICILIISFIFFGLVYYFLCDDQEFGGINILQEKIRNDNLKKFVNKIEKGQINNKKKDDITKKIYKGDISKNLDTKITNKKSINDSIKEKNSSQKVFDRIYFSIVTGTTLGYGDIYPLSNKLKIIVIFQLLTTISILFY